MLYTVQPMSTAGTSVQQQCQHTLVYCNIFIYSQVTFQSVTALMALSQEHCGVIIDGSF